MPNINEMADGEKRAWFMLMVVVATLGAFLALLAFTRSANVASAAFALTALLAAPSFRLQRAKRRGERILDERDHAIAHKALLAGFSVFWVALVIGVVGAGAIAGFDASVTIPIWALANIVWFAMLLVVGAESVAMILAYRGARDA